MSIQRLLGRGDHRPSGYDGVHVSSPIADFDDTLCLLSNARRRRVLRYLDTIDEGTTLPDLAEELGAIEAECPDVRIGSAERKRTYIPLYQNHLPMLADADVIGWDDRSRAVWPGPRFEAVVRVLYAVEESMAKQGGDSA